MAIRAIFSPGQTSVTVNGLHQWDKGLTLIVRDASLPEQVEIYFACSGMSEAVGYRCELLDGCVSACIPDHCLEQTTPVLAWVCEINSAGTRTLRTIVMPVTPRTKPGGIGESGELVLEDRVVELNLAGGDQTVIASEGKAMSEVVITKPDTMVPDNIREGVDIGGVVGTMTQEQVAAVLQVKALNVTANGEYNVIPDEGVDGLKKATVKVNVPALIVDAVLQEKTFTANGEYTPDTGYDGFSKVIVDQAEASAILQEKTVYPSTSDQSVTPDSDYDGLSKVTVEAMRLQDKTITQNGEVIADHGYDGLDKVTVKVEVSPNLQEKRVSPTTEAQEVEPDAGYDGLSKVTIAPVTSVIDENIKAGNIKEGVTILGVTGTLSTGGTSNLISFTIDGTSYQAEFGMTWNEWVGSDYNTDDTFMGYQGYIAKASNFRYNVSLDGTNCVLATDYIQAPQYTTIYISGAGGAD